MAVCRCPADRRVRFFETLKSRRDLLNASSLASGELLSVSAKAFVALLTFFFFKAVYLNKTSICHFPYKHGQRSSLDLGVDVMETQNIYEWFLIWNMKSF